MENLVTLGQVLGFIGLNYDVLEEKLPPEDESIYLWAGNNILIKDGKVEKIRGVEYLNDISTQLGASGVTNVLGIPIYRKYDGITKHLLAILPTKFYQLVSDTTWTAKTVDPALAGVNDSILSYANAGDKFYFVLDTQAEVYEWDGADLSKTEFTVLPADPAITLKAKFLLEYKTFLILLNTIEKIGEDSTAYHQRFWASNAGVITKFSSGDKFDLEVEGVINGGKKLEDSIIVYFKNGVYKITWQEGFGWTHRPVLDGLGLYCPKTLTGTKDFHFYISQEGLVQYLKGDIPRSVSDAKFDKLILDKIDPVYYYRAIARYFPHLRHLYVSFPKSGSTYNDVQLIYNVATRELVSYKDLVIDNYSAYADFEKDLSGISPDARKAYGMSFVPLFGTKDGYIKEQEITTYQDGISNYESNIVHPPTFWKDRSRNKRLLQIDLLIEKLTDEDITFVVDVASEANKNYTFNYTIAGNGNTGTRRYSIKSDNNGNEVDCFGKEFTVKIRDSNNPYGFRYKGAIFRGYYSTFK